MRSIVPRVLKSSVVWRVIPALLLVEGVVLLAFYQVERSRLRAVEKEVSYGNHGTETPPKHLWKFEMPGLLKPQALPASAVKLADGEEVIGVVVQGKARAYWMKALRYPPWHIVNDVVEGIPVSVTYCDRTDCTQAYTSGKTSAPLDINLAGLFGREMVVKVGGVLYFQKDGQAFEPSASAQSIPYIEHPWERTTWKQWRQRHPDSDVFIGEGGIGPKP